MSNQKAVPMATEVKPSSVADIKAQIYQQLIDKYPEHAASIKAELMDKAAKKITQA